MDDGKACTVCGGRKAAQTGTLCGICHAALDVWASETEEVFARLQIVEILMFAMWRAQDIARKEARV